jgi:hypothetical protein
MRSKRVAGLQPAGGSIVREQIVVMPGPIPATGGPYKHGPTTDMRQAARRTELKIQYADTEGSIMIIR